jgi:hypothetical protein
VDINLGAKLVTKIPDPKDGYGNLDDLGWFITGPGSIADGLVSVGYRF